MESASSFLHIARPLPGPGAPPTTTPVNVTIQPQARQPSAGTHKLTRCAQALLSILDHSMRGQVEQQRLIGSLLGTRSEDGSEVEIRSAYAVPHTETEEQVEVDFQYQKQMLALHLRANPREQLVG